MRQAIVTKFFGPTNHRGSRVKATAQVGSVTVSWGNRGIDENHEAAARILATKFGWLTDGWTLRGGGMPDGSGNVYVLVNPRLEARAAREQAHREGKVST